MMKKKKCATQKRKRGFSLIEVLFSVMLLGMTISTILISLSGQMSHVSSSNNEVVAGSFLQEGIEATRSIRDADWNALEEGTHGLSFASGTWGFASTSDTQDGFSRTVTVSDLTENERKVAVNVSWTGDGGRTRSSEVSTILTDWRHVEASPDGFEGDWHNPEVIGNMLDFGNGFRGISIDSSPNPASTLLFVAGYGSLSSAYELVVVDVSNPLVPFFRGSINTGTGANKVAVNDDETYAFIANANTSAQLQIVNVSNPDIPVLVKSFKVTGNNNTGRSIDLDGNYVYLGTEGPDTNEFFVIDASNVNNPIIKGSAKIGNDINDVSAGGGVAFAASDVDDREVTVISVANPSTVSVLKYIDLPGTNDAEELYYDEDAKRLYIGRKTLASANTPEFVILDVSNPSNPTIVGQMESDVSLDSLYGTGDMVFITSVGDLEFRAYDLTNLPNVAYYGGIDFGVDDVPTDMVRKGNYFFITIWGRLALRIISAY